MKKSFLVLILLTMGGCAWLQIDQETASRPVASPEEEMAPIADSEFSLDSALTILADPATSFTTAETEEPAATEFCLAPLTENDNLDTETLEDNLLLSGLDQHPPENEGLTLVADEMVFDFPVVQNEKVRYYIDYYTGPARKTFARWLQRSERYVPIMRKIFEEKGLPQDLTYLAMVESGFNDKAYSWAHAVGPWQFIEETGRGYGLENDWWRDERRDFEKSTLAAANFLGDLYQRFDGDWYLAVSAYNAGGGKISQAIRKYNTRDFWELSRGSYLRTETKNYLPKLLAVLTIAKDPEVYGFTDLDCPEPLEYDLVTIPDVTDLELVARLCEVSYEDIKALNPELKRWCTPPGIVDYQLRVPAGKKTQFEERYAQVPEGKRANYLRHRIVQGDTLGAIAKKYRIRVADIISLNKIQNPRALRIGRDLILPLHENYSSLPLEEMEDDYIRTRKKTYRVCSGDSLWSIARRFQVSEKELRVWNKLGWSNVIRPGQTLVVSRQSVRTAANGNSRSATVSAAKSSRKIVYQVQSGDTLWDISRKHSVPLTDIRRWNNLKENHILRPGDKLTLTVGSEYSG